MPRIFMSMIPSFQLLLLARLLAQTPDLPTRLSKTLDSLAAAGEFSGVFLLAKDGAPVFERAYGFADRETRTPNTVETAFNLGSINKLFTQIAIRQLADAGKLDVDSTLGLARLSQP
jgi:CubicO group peptidase (beta-lactamase class C family)